MLVPGHEERRKWRNKKNEITERAIGRMKGGEKKGMYYVPTMVSVAHLARRSIFMYAYVWFTPVLKLVVALVCVWVRHNRVGTTNVPTTNNTFPANLLTNIITIACGGVLFLSCRQRSVTRLVSSGNYTLTCAGKWCLADHLLKYIISEALQLTGLRAFVTVFMGASEQFTKHI